MKKDLKIFVEKYQPSKFKELKNGIEVRSVKDVEGASNKAKQLIERLKLNLVVVRDAKVAENSAFEVKAVSK